MHPGAEAAHAAVSAVVEHQERHAVACTWPAPFKMATSSTHIRECVLDEGFCVAVDAHVQEHGRFTR